MMGWHAEGNAHNTEIRTPFVGVRSGSPRDLIEARYLPRPTAKGRSVRRDFSLSGPQAGPSKSELASNPATSWERHDPANVAACTAFVLSHRWNGGYAVALLRSPLPVCRLPAEHADGLPRQPSMVLFSRSSRLLLTRSVALGTQVQSNVTPIRKPRRQTTAQGSFELWLAQPN